MQLKPINTRDVILASQAKWRSDILNQLGINHRCINHRYNEPKFSSGSLEGFIESVAIEKAKSLASEFPSEIIIAADQLACVNKTVLYKSGNRENAISQLKLLNGKAHRLICAVAVYDSGEIYSRIDYAELYMLDLNSTEIENYVDTDEPWDCAGSYKIESLGASLFEKIQVNDPTTIIGLPSAKLIEILRQMGYSNLLQT